MGDAQDRASSDSYGRCHDLHEAVPTVLHIPPMDLQDREGRGPSAGGTGTRVWRCISRIRLGVKGNNALWACVVDAGADGSSGCG